MTAFAAQAAPAASLKDASPLKADASPLKADASPLKADASPLKVLTFWGDHPRKSKLSGPPVPWSRRMS
jgi:hypothetical protein